jgi:hypothetical protein
MPVTPNYPGVYIEEISSGVRTITGVSTSVTAFVGTGKRGPINRAVHVLSYADYERRFGGLSADSEMSYAVRQFFINGGSEAWVVRLAGSSTTATKTLQDSIPEDVLKIDALDQGLSGNFIKVGIDYEGSENSFKLSLSFTDPDAPAISVSESFPNLSMSKYNPRFAESVVNGSSNLVKLTRVASSAVLAALGKGKSLSGYLTNSGDSSGTLVNVANLIDAGHSRFQVMQNGLAPVSVQLTSGDASGGTNSARLTSLCNAIKTQVSSNPGYGGFTCVKDGSGKRIEMTSGVAGENSKVVVLPGTQNDLSVRLKLGVLNGGDEIEAEAALRPTETPATPDVFLESGSETPVTALNAYTSYIGSQANRTGIYALESVDLFNILCLPGVSDAGILADSVAYCLARRAFLIVDAPSNVDTPDAMDTLIAGTSLPKSDHAAVYFPWVKIADPLNNGKPRLTAPSGMVAGLYARTDSARGVWKAPAGTEATLAAQGVEYNLTDLENGTLNPKGVNCIRLLRVYGTVVWGARTLRGADQMTSEWKYIPVRRTALFIEESLFRGTQWVVFEPNDEPLWAQIRLNVGAFMHTLFRQGAFQGTSPREAYFVKCDKETTTQDDINRGVVNILVGFAPLKPAEFVIIQIQQIAGQIQA